MIKFPFVQSLKNLITHLPGLTFLFALSLAIGSLPALAGSITCDHYWDTPTGRILSDRSVGLDVGPSPYRIESGSYICRLSIASSEEIYDRYLYIGEVGDAARIEVLKSTEEVAKVITHGLPPDGPPVYSRYIPLVTPIGSLLDTAGTVTFRLVYKDIFPLQVGIRSGRPSIETFWGSVRRFLLDSPSFSIHLLQIIACLIAAVAFVTWPGLTTRRRVLWTLSAMAAALTILQFTAIPRSFLSPIASMYLNDFVQVIACQCLVTASLALLGPTTSRQSVIFVFATSVVSLGAICIMLATAERNTLYVNVYAGTFFLLAVVPNLAAAYAVWTKQLFLITTPTPSRFAAFIYLVFAGEYLFDIPNLLAFKSRFIYFNHYFFYSGTVCLLFWAIRSENQYDLVVVNRLAELKARIIGSVSHFERPAASLLGELCSELGAMIASFRISITSSDHRRTKILAKFGSYHEDEPIRTVKHIGVGGLTADPAELRLGRAPGITDPGELTDYLIAYLAAHESEQVFLCATDFEDGHIRPFWQRRIHSLTRELSLVIRLVIGYKANQDKALLLEMLRSYIHPLQIASEGYFLSTFELGAPEAPIFLIVGDMVASTHLNETFGADKIRQVADEYFKHLLNTIKDLGVVLSLNLGDFVSIIIPCLEGEVSAAVTAGRAFAVMEALSRIDSDPVLHAIRVEAEVSQPIQYRFAMVMKADGSRVIDPAKKAVRSFQVLAESEIDSIFRVLGRVCQPGECLVIDTAIELAPDSVRMTELKPIRLKGKGRNKRMARFEYFNVTVDTPARGIDPPAGPTRRGA